MSDASPGKSVGAKSENRGYIVKYCFKTKKNRPKIEQFTGRTKSLEDVIFDISISNQSKLFMQTTKKLANYAGRKLCKSQDIKLRIENLPDVQILRPTFPKTVFTDPDYPTDEEKQTSKLNEPICGKEVDTYVKRVDEYRHNKSTMYSIIIGQCTEPLITKLEGMDKYDAINSSSDAILLLQAIREIVFEYESQKYPLLPCS